MPELPEVETIVRALSPQLVGRTIVGLTCNWTRMLKPGVRAARRKLMGREIVGVRRRGKFFVLSLGGEEAFVVIHLRMSGRLDVTSAEAAVGRHVHVRLGLSDGRELRFDDARKFGRVVVTTSVEELLRGLGPEPLSDEFTPGLLAELVRSRSRQLKPLLLDQSVISGLGNIYTDESLHRSGLNPLRRSDRLSLPEVTRLHAAIRATLTEGIASKGASIDWVYPGGGMQMRFRVYGKAGEPCGVCGVAIRRIVVGQRDTFLPEMPRVGQELI